MGTVKAGSHFWPLESAMRVLVNGTSALGGKTGVGHYTAQLLRCLRAQAPHDLIESFPSPWVRKPRALWQRLRSRPQREPVAPGAIPAVPGEPRRGWKAWCVGQTRSLVRTWLTAELHFRGRRGGFDLYHEPNNIPLPTDLPTIVTIPDVSVLLYPEWHPADRVAEYAAHFHKGLAQGRHFLAISEFTRQELIHKLGLHPEQVTRTYMGVRPGLGPMAEVNVQAVLRRLGLPPRYFLYLGTIEPRKNLMTLLRAYVKLPPEVRERFPLLLAGGWGWNSGDVAAFLHDEARHRGVITTGYLPEEHLGAVLNGARALVYPSFYEGFGLPPVEMMACGGAVLCSTAGALVETAGGRAHLVEPLDEDGWREALRRAATDDDWQAELRRGAVEAVRQFTWERCAADTLAVYRSVCGQSLRKAA
jgi:glycosyltransferase involved in cell wall biosynthesis